VQTLEELKVDYYAKRKEMWDAKELSEKSRYAFLVAERAYQRAHETLNKEERRTYDC
jgi:hypothetical protein